MQISSASPLVHLMVAFSVVFHISIALLIISALLALYSARQSSIHLCGKVVGL